MAHSVHLKKHKKILKYEIKVGTKKKEKKYIETHNELVEIPGQVHIERAP